MRTTNALSLPSASSPPGRRLPNWRVWLLAHLRAPWVDRQLAAGTPPWHSRLHAARSVQLTSGHRRRALARALEELLEQAGRRARSGRSAAVPPCREQVREALPLILEISTRLRSNEPVDARGIARLGGLLADGGGPCYVRTHPEALKVALNYVCQCLGVSD